MRLAPTPLFSSVLCLLLAACGGGGGETTETTAQTTGNQTTGPNTTGGTETTTGGLTTGPGETTLGGTGTGTSTGEPITTTHGHTTVEPGTTTDEPAMTATSVDPGTSSTGAPETTTGGMSGGPCEVDSDCALHDDCCDCYGHPKDEQTAICKALCDVTTCQEWGVDAAICVDGQCAIPKSKCSGEVACDALPPECPKGTLPGIDPNGACWTGGCVPAEQCESVSGCGDCPEGQMCVQNVSFMMTFTCKPIPDGCAGEPSCACAADEVCVEPFGVCNDKPGEADVACICVTC